MSALRTEKEKLQIIIQSLKSSSPEAAAHILANIPSTDDSQSIELQLPQTQPPQRLDERHQQHTAATADVMQCDESAPESDFDVSPFISIDEEGNLASFGPSSALQSSTLPPPAGHGLLDRGHLQNRLIANAILTRQREYNLYSRADLDGVPIDLGMHLLDLHWNRQHYTFLLTYRPAIMRDLLQGGPYSSKFLLNAIFACSAKFSQRVEVRDIPCNPTTAGARWFRRCDQLLCEDQLLVYPSIPTVVGLTLLGSTYNARGEVSKGWLFTGYAIRMAYDLGLHIDCTMSNDNAEEVEIRRRVFWGVFVCDKLQSLYMGRPIAIHLKDAHVSHEFLDTMEEEELWTPYIDPTINETGREFSIASTPIRSVSCFQQLCSLSKIMTDIITNFYVIGATAARASKSLLRIDKSLEEWMTSLPDKLRFVPTAGTSLHTAPSPNILNIHTIYYTLIILLHRPMITDGHLRSTNNSTLSLQRCTDAARAIIVTVQMFHDSYGLRGAPYLIAYALYVACTIHVRSTTRMETNTEKTDYFPLLASGLSLLDELSVPNPGVLRPATIISKLMATKGIQLTATVGRGDSEAPRPYQRMQQLSAMSDPRAPAVDEQLSLIDTEPEKTADWLGELEDPFTEDLLYGFMDG